MLFSFSPFPLSQDGEIITDIPSLMGYLFSIPKTRSTFFHRLAGLKFCKATLNPSLAAKWPDDNASEFFKNIECGFSTALPNAVDTRTM